MAHEADETSNGKYSESLAAPDTEHQRAPQKAAEGNADAFENGANQTLRC
jgi:hypothetical protein